MYLNVSQFSLVQTMSYNLRQRQRSVNYTAPKWKIGAVRLSNRSNLTKLDKFLIPDRAIFALTRHKREQKRAAEADPKYKLTKLHI